MQKLLVVLLFIGWTSGCTWYYTCQIRHLCGESSASAKHHTEPKKEAKPHHNDDNTDRPISFNYNSPEPLLGSNWDELKDSIENLCLDQTSQLNIIGLFSTDEKKPKNLGFRNLGLARASALKKLLEKSIPKEQLHTSSQIVAAQDHKEINNHIVFQVYKEDLSKASIVETNSGLKIYFPSGSAEALLTPELSSRLNNIALEMVGSDGGANIKGHTDNQGDPKMNHDLGKKRADMIRDLFIEKGVKPDNLRSTSMGQTQPEGDNETEAGRAKNRRIEITFNDNL